MGSIHVDERRQRRSSCATGPPAQRCQNVFHPTEGVRRFNIAELMIIEGVHLFALLRLPD